MSKPPLFEEARRQFHAALLSEGVLRVSGSGVPSNADKDNRSSVRIARGIAERLGSNDAGERLAGQSSGNRFEAICADFLSKTFGRLGHLRPGEWAIQQTGGRNRLLIAQFEQYEHLVALHKAASGDPELAAALGNDYTITPDIVISREPEEDEVINGRGVLVGEDSARFASLRKSRSPRPILHASVSCKWTIRSDRAQNARSEGLNLVRNRKGRLPHVAVVIGEPLPSRIASIALGTGDIDCVYHFARHELSAVVDELDLDDAGDMLRTMIDGKRLRDISDLPLDLAV